MLLEEFVTSFSGTRARRSRYQTRHRKSWRIALPIGGEHPRPLRFLQSKLRSVKAGWAIDIISFVSNITRQDWGSLPGGEAIELYTIRNAKGVEASITTLGGRLVTLKTPDRDGHFDDIVLGFDSLAGYLVKNPFFGALVGRFANRIAEGQFVLDGQTYTLVKNNGPNSLHGGTVGFDKVRWHAYPGDSSLTLLYQS
jgi:hypothetical protein